MLWGGVLPVVGMVGVFWERTLGIVGWVGWVVARGAEKCLERRRLGETIQVELWGNRSKTVGK